MSASDRLRREKKAIRAELRAVRDALPPAERAARSVTIARHLLSVPELARARTVMVFSSFGSEVDTLPIVDALVAQARCVALPRIEEGDIIPVTYRPGDPLRPAKLGMREPAGGDVLAPDELDAVVAPALGFDRHGYRVGYGGGFYDRLFARTAPGVVKAGVCFAAQVIDHVPHGPHDVQVDLVVTEGGVLRCG